MSAVTRQPTDHPEKEEGATLGILDEVTFLLSKKTLGAVLLKYRRTEEILVGERGRSRLNRNTSGRRKRTFPDKQEEKALMEKKTSSLLQVVRKKKKGIGTKISPELSRVRRTPKRCEREWGKSRRGGKTDFKTSKNGTGSASASRQW